MARSAQTWTEAKIERLRGDGYGEGSGRDYKPWLTMTRVISGGISKHTPGQTTDRVHHFLFNIEESTYPIYDWSDAVTDIREQFPLDRDEIRAIVEKMGIRYPIYRGGNVPVVMTTDFFTRHCCAWQTGSGGILAMDRPQVFGECLDTNSLAATTAYLADFSYVRGEADIGLVLTHEFIALPL